MSAGSSRYVSCANLTLLLTAFVHRSCIENATTRFVGYITLKKDFYISIRLDRHLGD
jgi:hypothetical protein